MRRAVLVVVSSLLVSVSVDSIAQIEELDKEACEKKGGTQTCTEQAIPGNGNRHNFSVQAPAKGAKFLGGYVRTFRQGLDNSYRFTCPMNPQQPPTPGNSTLRRCSPDAQDMSVEKCGITSGSSPNLSCEYVNATGANPKMIELCGCWK